MCLVLFINILNWFLFLYFVFILFLVFSAIVFIIFYSLYYSLLVI